MKITTFQQRILTAAPGMVLYNPADRAIGQTVYLGRTAPADAWQEITQAQADALQAQWDAEAQAVPADG